LDIKNHVQSQDGSKKPKAKANQQQASDYDVQRQQRQQAVAIKEIERYISEREREKERIEMIVALVYGLLSLVLLALGLKWIVNTTVDVQGKVERRNVKVKMKYREWGVRVEVSREVLLTIDLLQKNMWNLSSRMDD